MESELGSKKNGAWSGFQPHALTSKQQSKANKWHHSTEQKNPHRKKAFVLMIDSKLSQKKKVTSVVKLYGTRAALVTIECASKTFHTHYE